MKLDIIHTFLKLVSFITGLLKGDRLILFKKIIFLKEL